MTCFLPRANDITQYQIAGYALFGHFGLALGGRMEAILREAWGERWYERVFPGAPPAPREDHFDPEAVLRALVGREVARPPSAGDRVELKHLLFPSLTDRDLRELRALRGAYAHYEGSLATVGEVRQRLSRTLVMLRAVAGVSWRDLDLERQVTELESRVASLEAGTLIAEDKAAPSDPATQYEEQLRLAVWEMQRSAAEREAKRVSRSALRLGDPYEGPEGRRELRLLRSADELWGVKERSPASSAFDASSVQDAARGMRNFLIDPQLFLDEDDLSLSTSLLGTLRYVGQLRLDTAQVTAATAVGEPWSPTSLLLPRSYRITSSGGVFALDDDVPPLGADVIAALARGFASARAHAGAGVDSADLRVSLAGDIVVWLGEVPYLVATVSSDQWFPGHFDLS